MLKDIKSFLAFTEMSPKCYYFDVICVQRLSYMTVEPTVAKKSTNL